MTDKNHKPVFEGALCRFYAHTRNEWMIGVVRKVAVEGHLIGSARVDDGAPNNDDPCTNGFHVSAWVEPWDIEVLP